MKASPRQQRLLLELQQLDTQKVRLSRRLAKLPEREQLEALVGRQAETRDRFMQTQRSLEDLETELGRIETEAETIRQRHIRTTERLAASTQSKEATALQEELDMVLRRQGVLEKRQLDLMERVEEATGLFGVASADVADVENESTRLRESIRDAERVTEQELADVSEERDGLAAEVQGPVLEVYEQTRERYGIGAARLNGRVSEGSNMELDAADYQSAVNTPADEIYFCPTSGAILVRGLDEDPVN